MTVVISEFFGLTGKVESSLAHFPFMCNINGNNLLASIPLPIGLSSHPPAHGLPTFPKSPSLAYLSLVFVTGWCGARLHSPDATVTRGRGGHPSGNPLPALVLGPPAFIPWMGPICYHIFLTGTHLGYGRGGGLSGDMGRECRKRHPAPVS